MAESPSRTVNDATSVHPRDLLRSLFCLIIAYAVLVSFKFVSRLPPIDSGQCWLILSLYWLGVAVVIFGQIHSIREKYANLMADTLFKPHTWQHLIARHPFLIFVICLFSSLVGSVSLLIFVTLAETWALVVLLCDAIAFAYFFHGGGYLADELVKPTERFALVVRPISQIVLNSLFLLIAFVAVDLFFLKWHGPSPEYMHPLFDSDAVATQVIDKVKCCCWPMRTLLRLAYLTDYMTKSILVTVEREASYLFWFLYLLHLKTLPAIFASLYFRFFVRGKQ